MLNKIQNKESGPALVTRYSYFSVMFHSINSPPDQISRYLDNQCDDHCLAAAFKSLTCNLWYFSGLDDKMSMPEGKFPVIFAPFIIFPFYLTSLISTTNILDLKLFILDTEYWR